MKNLLRVILSAKMEPETRIALIALAIGEPVEEYMVFRLRSSKIISKTTCGYVIDRDLLIKRYGAQESDNDLQEYDADKLEFIQALSPDAGKIIEHLLSLQGQADERGFVAVRHEDMRAATGVSPWMTVKVTHALRNAGLMLIENRFDGNAPVLHYRLVR